MGRGYKTCKICGSIEGPRSRHCKNGHGFVIKGMQYPNVDPKTLVSPNEARSISAKSENLPYLMQFVKECTDEEEIRVREKYYGLTSETWDSICGNFRIRYGKTFMRINPQSPPYMLTMKCRDGSWGMCPGKQRFKTLPSVIKYMIWWRQQDAKTRLEAEQEAKNKRLEADCGS